MLDPSEHLENGLKRERAGLLDAALDRYRRAAIQTDDPAVVAQSLRHQADAFRQRCDWTAAVRAARRSAEIASQAGLVELHLEALNAEAAVYLSRGEFDAAARLLQSVLGLTDDPRLRGIAQANLAGIAARRGDLEEAARAFHRSRECYQEAGYRRGEALVLNDIGRVMLDGGDATGAAAFLRQAVDLARAVEDGELVALAMMNLGEALLHEGKIAGAEEMVGSALGFFAMSGNSWRRVEALKLLGDIHVRRMNVGTGVACYQRGLALAREIGARPEIEVLERRMAELTGTDT